MSYYIVTNGEFPQCITSAERINNVLSMPAEAYEISEEEYLLASIAGAVVAKCESNSIININRACAWAFFNRYAGVITPGMF